MVTNAAVTPTVQAAEAITGIRIRKIRLKPSRMPPDVLLRQRKRASEGITPFIHCGTSLQVRYKAEPPADNFCYKTRGSPDSVYRPLSAGPDQDFP